MPTVSVRLSDDDAAALDEAAALLEEDKSSVMRAALRDGVTRLRTRHAVGRYQAGEVSAVQAARLAGVSPAEWLAVARERNLTTQLTPADLRSDAAGARTL